MSAFNIFTVTLSVSRNMSFIESFLAIFEDDDSLVLGLLPYSRFFRKHEYFLWLKTINRRIFTLENSIGVVTRSGLNLEQAISIS